MWHSASEWVGKTLKNVRNIGDDELVFEFDDDTVYKMYHSQDCCESVYIESIVGDLSDLIGSPLTISEEVTSGEDPEPISEYDDSYTWTFYKFATEKGYVDVRWYGSSNGYYSESVDIYKVA